MRKDMLDEELDRRIGPLQAAKMVVVMFLAEPIRRLGTYEVLRISFAGVGQEFRGHEWWMRGYLPPNQGVVKAVSFRKGFNATFNHATRKWMKLAPSASSWHGSSDRGADGARHNTRSAAKDGKPVA